MATKMEEKGVPLGKCPEKTIEEFLGHGVQSDFFITGSTSEEMEMGF